MASQQALKRVPKSFTVGPYEYQVSFDATAAYDYMYYGVCLYRSKRVMLDPLQSDTELPQTFLHEALHALGQAYDIDDLMRHKETDGKIVDKIDLFASALLEFIRRNPETIKWMQGR